MPDLPTLLTFCNYRKLECFQSFLSVQGGGRHVTTPHDVIGQSHGERPAPPPRPVHNSSLETHPQLIHCELPVQTVQTLFILASERLAFRLKGFLFLSVSRLCWDGSEIDITSGWVHRASNLMFTLRSDKDQRKKLLSLSFGVNEPLVSTKYLYLLYSFSSTNLSLADRGGGR